MTLRCPLAALVTVAVLAAGAFVTSAQTPAVAPPTASSGTPAAPADPEAARLAFIIHENARHFGSDPDDPGPLAADLSPALQPAAIEKAMRKVADWQLAQSQQYFVATDTARQIDGRIWTWAALYDGYTAAGTELREPKYIDAMRAVGKAYDWQLIAKLPALLNADNMSVAQSWLVSISSTRTPARSLRPAPRSMPSSPRRAFR